MLIISQHKEGTEEFGAPGIELKFGEIERAANLAGEGLGT